jgi:peptide deformylase
VEHSFKAFDFFARAIQHEFDHLYGVLFLDKAKDIYHYDHKKNQATPLV